MGTGQWKNRIVGSDEVAPDSLLANPLNWRVHPKHQQDALKGVIDEVGFVSPVLVQAGTDVVVDGHMRVTLALRDNIATIPVIYLDLDDNEVNTILATFDPISALAATDAAQLDALLRDVSTSDAAVMQMLADLAEREGVIPTSDGDWADAFGGVPDGDKSPFQQMTFTVTDDQAETINRALSTAKGAGSFNGTGNENSNGNALARICEAYRG
jgi:hypothetical protein